ncbi:Metallo-dependent phosphatase [Fomitiporia mediterranea MF3/22]|uniref:Metallo-dependent phosphatase n=1 Tax=Fomitiporia mediterranea (strain MF3/22) TaxID=694068 RepID=UPI00044077F4|nr:Metallo-dependent phosphatase [Fomitiporia mediterranea MF3/22]EJC99583.1 Metallo-dependent phosphatase [Fomitiporia mediterranea MF3/22]
MRATLPILHFNDVYRVSTQKLSGGRTIDVTQFAAMLDNLREAWPKQHNRISEGLVLFSGDLFAPSVESSITRGSHMVPVINELAPDVAVVGNHEFDFGYPQLTKLLDSTKFPWLLSNIVDEATGKVPEYLHEFHILERCGVRIGFIGLVESEWIATVPAWPESFKHKNMAEVAMELSQLLRNPDGEYQCDLIIALTHSRIPNDILLAKSIGALSPAHQRSDFVSTHGADIILGGHDHLYYASRGVTSWDGYDAKQEVLGAELDEDVLIVKSGTDFRDLSEIILEVEDTPEGSVRRKIIKSVRGKRHQTQPNSPSSQKLKDILSKTLDTVSNAIKKPVCMASGMLDLRSEFLRTSESATGNWFADVIHHAYDDPLSKMGIHAAHGTLLCAGALRGDTTYGPGKIALGDIMEILPFDDSIVALELDGYTIWEVLEVGLSTWPAHEGRFPVISGFRVNWDSRKPPGQRVQNIAVPVHDCKGKPASIDSMSDELEEYEEIIRERGGRKYVVITREYMADGHDGFDCLKGQKMLIDDEQGQMMSTIVRRYLGTCLNMQRDRRVLIAYVALETEHRDNVHHPSQEHENMGTPKTKQSIWASERATRSAWGMKVLLSKDTLGRAGNNIRRSLTYMHAVIQFSAYYCMFFALASRENSLRAENIKEKIKKYQVANQPADVHLPVVAPFIDGRLRDLARTQ